MKEKENGGRKNGRKKERQTDRTGKRHRQTDRQRERETVTERQRQIVSHTVRKREGTTSRVFLNVLISLDVQYAYPRLI